MMKSRLWLATCCVALAATANAENITESNVAQARTAIDSAVAAYGGAERLAAMKSLVIEHETRASSVQQSLRPEPPWDSNDNRGMDAVDFDKEIFVSANTGTGGGFEFDNSSIINGEQSYQLDFRAGTATPVLEPDFNTSAGPFERVTPALLVRQAQQRAHTAHYLGEVEYEGAPHDVVGFAMEVGPAISIYINKETGLLSRSERVIPNFGLVEYTFHDYRPVDGIQFNRSFKFYANGDINMDRRNVRTQVNASVASYTDVKDSLLRVDAQGPDELSSQEIADGVYLIGGGGTYAMFVDMGEFIVAAGGTAGMPDRIAELRKAVPDKPIRYGVLTHHHSDHILAVPTYADEGATVIAAAAHAGVVQATVEEAGKLKLETVDKRKVIKSKKRRVEIIDIGPTAHTEHLLVTWLPKEKVLFEADHFAMPRTGPVRPAVSSTRTFAAALREQRLQPAVFVSAHSPRTGTHDDLQSALEAPTANKQAVADRK